MGLLAALLCPQAGAAESRVTHPWRGWYRVDVHSTNSDGARLDGYALFTVPAAGPISVDAEFDEHYQTNYGYCDLSESGHYSLHGTHSLGPYGGQGPAIGLDVSTAGSGGYVIQPSDLVMNARSEVSYFNPPQGGSCGDPYTPDPVLGVGIQGVALPDGTVLPDGSELCGQSALSDETGCQPAQEMLVTAGGTTSYDITYPATATWDFSSSGDACPDAASESPDGCPGIAVASIGDSVAAGEGNKRVSGPDRAGTQCHRSEIAGPPIAFEALQQTRPFGSVSSGPFSTTNIACSGATIARGLLGPYEGFQKLTIPKVYDALRKWLVKFLYPKRRSSGNDPLAVIPRYPTDLDYPAKPAQLDQVSSSIPALDALVISIGANDLGFSSLVQACATQGLRQRFAKADAGKPGGFGDSCENTEAGEIFTANVTRLLSRFRELNARLKELRMPSDRVYLTQYFDPTHDVGGDYCDSMLGIHRREDLAWAAGVVSALNSVLRVAAGRHGWNYIGGIAADFAGGAAGASGHGYCAGRQRWVTTLTDSLSGQGDIFGTLHPNETGQRCIATHIWETLDQAFYGSWSDPWLGHMRVALPALPDSLIGGCT